MFLLKYMLIHVNTCKAVLLFGFINRQKLAIKQKFYFDNSTHNLAKYQIAFLKQLVGRGCSSAVASKLGGNLETNGSRSLDRFEFIASYSKIARRSSVRDRSPREQLSIESVLFSKSLPFPDFKPRG